MTLLQLESELSSSFVCIPSDLTTETNSTCNDADDAEGCIISQGLLVEDVTPEEIDAAVQVGVANAASVAEEDVSSTEVPTACFQANLATAGARRFASHKRRQ